MARNLVVLNHPLSEALTHLHALGYGPPGKQTLGRPRTPAVEMAFHVIAQFILEHEKELEAHCPNICGAIRYELDMRKRREAA